MIHSEKILFLDIETVPAFSSYEDVPERFKKLWDRKAEALKKQEGETAENNYPRAGIYAEFGKIICVSCGFYNQDKFRLKSFYGHDEKQVLLDFAALLNQYFNTPEHLLCAHNGKEFDYPYLSRRMLVHRIPLPKILDISMKKPWEVTLLDTMEMWKFGDYKSYTSLELLAAIFDVPTPKDDITGADVWKVYWQQNDLQRIVTYCEKDVVTVARIYFKIKGLPDLPDEQIQVVSTRS